MSRAQLPEDLRPDYDAKPKTEYVVTFEDGTSTTVTGADYAQTLAEGGVDVGPARRCYDE
jgi:hypothetical protein